MRLAPDPGVVGDDQSAHDWAHNEVLSRAGVEPSALAILLRHRLTVDGRRLRQAGLLGSMGKVASAYDNALMESFFGSLQIERLDRGQVTIAYADLTTRPRLTQEQQCSRPSSQLILRLWWG